MRFRIALMAAFLAVVAIGYAQAQSVPAHDAPFQVRYAANLAAGESYINIVNTGANGAPLQGPGFGADKNAGNICVNVYTFAPDEQLISCCSCLVTANQVVNLGVNRDLVSKTLTGVVPSSVTVKLLATFKGSSTITSCSNSAADSNFVPVAAGMAAWGTTLHAQPGGGFATTETPFIPATLSGSELESIRGRCAAIIGNGSGYGICASCRLGALGAVRR
jgi:hypothetical protein